MACTSISKSVPLSSTFFQDADMIILKQIVTSTWGGQLRLVVTDGIRPPTIIAQVTTNYPDSVLSDLADQVYSSEYSNMFYWYPQTKSLMLVRGMARQVMAKLEYDFPATAQVNLVTYKRPLVKRYADSFVPYRNIATQICPQCNYQWDHCQH